MATLNPIVSFDGINGGANPISGLSMDAFGDLFGATQPNGGGDGKVCEIEKTGGAYASTATVIASFGFDQAIDAFLNSGVITDCAGDVFGVADGGLTPRHPWPPQARCSR